jgi:hypothetical protein
MIKSYWYIHDCARVLKINWEEGRYLDFVRRLCTRNHFKTKKEALKKLEQIKQVLNATTATKTNKRNARIRPKLR